MKAQGLVGAAFVLLATAPPVAQADEVADFYKGETVNAIVGCSPGGVYDTRGRVRAEHLGRYIPGNPTVVIRNRAPAA